MKKTGVLVLQICQDLSRTYSCPVGTYSPAELNERMNKHMDGLDTEFTDLDARISQNYSKYHKQVRYVAKHLIITGLFAFLKTYPYIEELF